MGYSSPSGLGSISEIIYVTYIFFCFLEFCSRSRIFNAWLYGFQFCLLEIIYVAYKTFCFLEFLQQITHFNAWLYWFQLKKCDNTLCFCIPISRCSFLYLKLIIKAPIMLLLRNPSLSNDSHRLICIGTHHQESFPIWYCSHSWSIHLSW